MILTATDLPLKVYPTSAKQYCTQLQEYLQSQIANNLRYSGYLTKTVGKQTFTVYVFTPDNQLSEVLVIDSSLAGITNFPPSDRSLAQSANQKFNELLSQGWVYSGSFLKKISTSNYTYLVFYKLKKPISRKPNNDQ